ncbi:hypothetical protein VTN00DRAFT_9596 [Thermoascus crustaceus]|uniref:uncharacterized protein n=1 Tax=Thermoascus crustaceus TaxID=5088 RepID=UPI0037423004
MAARFGERLLAEVRGEGLDELLRDLRALHPRSAPSPSLGVRELDELLDAFLGRSSSSTVEHEHEQERAAPVSDPPEQWEGVDDAVPEDGFDAPSTALPQPNRGVIETQSRRRKRCPVVEIASASSAAGKSQLLYYLTAVAVLPARVGGRDAAVVFLDTDGRFDAGRLRDVAASIIRQDVKTSTAPADVEAVDMEIRSALTHVHVLRPQSSSSLLATLRSLDSYLLDLPAHRSANRPLAAILLDSASAFFWQDRLRDEVARTEEIGRPAADVERDRDENRSFHMSVLYRKLVDELKRLQGVFDCAVVYTASGTARVRERTRGDTRPRLSVRPYLPAPWGAFPVMRVVVQRDPVRPFPPSLTPEEAPGEAPLRQEVVGRGRFSGWVDDEVPREMKGRGLFSFCITAEGVVFEDGDHNHDPGGQWLVYMYSTWMIS